MIFRPAHSEDLPAITEIYNHYVMHSVCTFETEPRPIAQWADWLAEHRDATPAIVAISDDAVVGWGSLSRWNNRCAYRFSVEDSVYVRHDCHRHGIGLGLLRQLIDRARALGLRSVVAQIADHQPASEQLHERFDFRRVGCLERIGYKFDRWIDVVIWQLQLEGGDAS